MRSLIIGATGQDGSLLAEHLLNKGFEVHGTFRKGSTDKFWRLLDLNIYKSINLHPYNIGSEMELGRILKKTMPDYIFMMAAESFTHLSFDEPNHYLSINTGGTIELLEAVRNLCPESKVFLCSSSEIFGPQDNEIRILDEKSLTIPINPYGISKLAIGHFARIYRDQFKLNLYTGILFPHESPYKSREFVTKKISRGLVRTKFRDTEPMVLRGINMSRDWGAARDYVQWMLELLEKGNPGEYVFATGINSSVRDLLELSLSTLELEIVEESDLVKNRISFREIKSGKILIESDSSHTMLNSLTYPPGSNAKLFGQIGNRRLTPLREIVREMIEKEISWL